MPCFYRLFKIRTSRIIQAEYKKRIHETILLPLNLSIVITKIVLEVISNGRTMG